MKKGKDHEASHPKSIYQNYSYFELTQLGSLIYQISAVRAFAPKNIVEIGVGSGFTSQYLRNAGYDVTTIDINKNLNPDICIDISRIPEVGITQFYDLVVCCQVLEHIPLSELENNISILSKLGKNLYLTLPSYFSYFGLGGIIRLPFIRKEFSLYLRSPLRIKNLENSVHFWEVNSEKMSQLEVIKSVLLKYYNHIEIKKIPLNPYHIQFKCFRDK